MAVKAQYNVAAHDPRANGVEVHDDTTSSALFPGGHLLAAAAVGGSTVFSDPRSSLTRNRDNYSACFAPVKRARVRDGLMIMEGHSGALLPLPVPDAQGRALCSGAASTSGRSPAALQPVSRGLLSHLHRHCVDADTLIRVENERLRAGLQEARRRHMRAAVSALEAAAARRLRDAEAALASSLRRNAELEHRVREVGAEGQAWEGVARTHEAVAAGLRATLDQLRQAPCAGSTIGEAEDALSCCFEQREEGGDDASARTSRACRSCGEAGACVLLLPCRHLCLCARCDAAAEECPVCAAAKNASLHVLLS